MSLTLDSGPQYPRRTLWHFLSRPAGLLLSPLLLGQGRIVRSSNPRLPNAPLPWSGTISASKPLSLLGLGDSTIAGVGVDNPMQGLTAQVAKALYTELGRGVGWDSFGQRGITTGQLLSDYLPQALVETPHADIVLVSIGANDVKNLKPRRAAVRNINTVVDRVHEAFPNALVLVSALPAFNQFDTLPNPLRAVMEGHGKAIEVGARRLIEAKPFALMSPPPSIYPPGFFAADGFHPGAEGYRIWAEFAVTDAVGRGALEHLRAR